MQALRTTKFILGDVAAAALSPPCAEQDYRDALCRWEDALFARFPDGHHILDVSEATALIATVFGAFDRPAPALEIVAGFDDPRIGGFADIPGILILHESAHLLVPTDQRHGAMFTYVLQILYRMFIGIPEHPIRELLECHGLPSHTDLPAGARFDVAA